MQAIILGTGNHIQIPTPLENVIHKHQSKVQNSCPCYLKTITATTNKYIELTVLHLRFYTAWSVSMTIKGMDLTKKVSKISSISGTLVI